MAGGAVRAGVLLLLIPLLLVAMVSFWDYNDYELIPAFTFAQLPDDLRGLHASFADLCVTLKTYLVDAEVLPRRSWAITLVRRLLRRLLPRLPRPLADDADRCCFVLCTIPFWTSNVIRMISWMPLLGRNGLVNQALIAARPRRQAGRVAAVLRLLGGARLRAPLHDVHDRADLQLDDAHRPLAARGRRRRRRVAAGRRCGT